MKKLSIIASLLLACSSAFAAVPSFSGMELKKIDGSTTFTEMDAGEAIQITLKNVSDGGKTDTKRRFYVEKNYVKGQGVFSILTKDQVLWQAPKVAGTYKIASYLENADGNSAVITQDVIVRDPYVSNPGRNNCPVNFVFVPGSQGLHGAAKGWCIMKYEASPYSLTDMSGTLGNNGNTVSYDAVKVANEFATSKPLNPIYYSGSLSNAKNRCSAVKDSNGNTLSNTSIISIDVWISMVRDLYKQPFNWTGNGIGSEMLKVGHTDNSPAYPIISSYDDLDDFYLTGNSFISGNIFNNAQKRTMKTSYNDIIWDIVGNAKEYFRENYNSNASQPYTYTFYDTPSASYTQTYNSNPVFGYKHEFTLNFSYTNPYLNDTYLKLLPYNVLGFKPGSYPNKYISVQLSSYSQGANYTVGSINSAIRSVVSPNGYIKQYTSLYSPINLNIYQMNSAETNSLGYGALMQPNTTGKIGYNIGVGNPILYGGAFDAAAVSTNQNSFTIASKNTNAGLLSITSFTNYTGSTIIGSDTTTAPAGFRCMTEAN